jgi:DNA polymerase-3 subunit alpha
MGLPKDRAKRAKDLGMTALAITDHGTLSGLPDHYFSCLEQGIKPILGLEAYHADQFLASKEMKRYHLTLLAENLDGYYSIAQMSSDAYTQNFYRYPICDFELLEKYSKGVICLSGCVLGMLSQTILNDSLDQARRYTERFLQIYGDRFFFEVQPQEFDAQKYANDGILTLAQEFDRPVVMTSDSHYVSPEDLDSYVLLRQMNYHMPKPLTAEQLQKKEERDTRRKEREEKKRQKEQEELLDRGISSEDIDLAPIDTAAPEIETDDMFTMDMTNFADSIRAQYGKLYMPSGSELASRWQAFMGTNGEQYVLNSQMIADMCDVKLEFPELVPKAVIEVDPVTQQPIPSKKILIKKVKQGLIEMGVYNKIEAREVKDENGEMQIERYRPYYERAVYEIKRITEKKMEDYFLLVADLVEEARRRDIAVGPGRGSGGASLVARALGITEFDPVAFDCMFDRFLPESRTNLPDIDLDFGSHRDELKAYMIQKYNGKAAEICNINRLTRDVLINDLARILVIPEEVVLAMKNIIAGMGIGVKDKTIYPEYLELMKNRDLAQFDRKYSRVIFHFCKLYGSMRGYSKHASGLAISSGNLSQYAPLFVRAKETYTAYEKKYLEALNVVKIDILKIDAIAALQNMCKMVGIKHQDIPQDDAATYDAFCKLDVVGIFQFESPGAQKIVREVQPRTINDLAVCTGLNRPGGMELGSMQIFIDGKNGKIDMTTPLARCCRDTYGALIYQEHVLTACREVGHMSWKSAVKVMKTLHGQNHRDSPLPQEFIQGAVQHEGMTEDEAWAMYQKLTSYTFNKAHAIAYALIAYWMMYMKVHYPFEFFLSILRLEGDEKKREIFIADAYQHKQANGDRVVTLISHVNGLRTFHAVTIDGHRFIRMGLQAIDKVGPSAAIAIEREWKANGDFKNEDDLLRRVNGTRYITKGRGDKKETFEEFNKSPIKSDTLTALRETGAAEFDMKAYQKRCSDYLGNLVHRKKKWYEKKRDV